MTEDKVEQNALDLLQSLGFGVLHGPDGSIVGEEFAPKDLEE